MFNFLKKQAKTVTIVAPADGQAMPVTAVSDPMFAQKIMGDGYAVKPSSDAVYAPVSGQVVSVFPTKHAISLRTADGLEVLLHMGVDTVELKGGPFALTVSDGQTVTAGDALGTMDRAAIAAAGKSDELIVVFTNMDKVKAFPTVAAATVTHGQTLGDITLA
ncbi:PTS sugar transporter subunit IIA [Lacticaseibacillus daqingensis]|uniref:PTS sugar transporter subunit IIA n=1 Tax=Lacticaseibacillus daqingensis TaxID=2486014 RepID=UPI000F7A379E|nr:PTS glucose transporter subunit IIA [Lacticaseibacillus daqingensis]